MDGRPPLHHKESGTFDKLLDPNSPFDELIPVDEDFLHNYMSELSGMNVDTQGGQPTGQQMGGGGGLHHETSLSRHQQLLVQQQQQQQQAMQAAQMDTLQRNSTPQGLSSDPYGSGPYSSGLAGSGGSAQMYTGGEGEFASRQNFGAGMPGGDGNPGLRADSAPANYAEQQQQAISSMLQQYGRPSGGYDLGGAAGLDFGGGGGGGAPGGDLRTVSAGSAFGGGVPQGFQPGFSQPMGSTVPSSFAGGDQPVPQLVVAGQQQQPPPNLVISGAPLQPEFGGGTSGTAGRVANHPIVVAGGNTPPEPAQYGMEQRGNGAPSAAAYGGMPPPAARRGNATNTYDRLAGQQNSPSIGGQPAGSGGSDELPDQYQGEYDGDDMDGADGEPMTKNRRHRTLRQQMLNKQAQQRYRERKKMKASELEHTVAALTTQLEAMQGVRTENVELQDKNLTLVGQLRAREEELERLLREQAAQPAYMKTNSGRVLEMPKTEEGPTTQQELQELTSTYEAAVRELREIVAKNGLDNKDGTDIDGTKAPEAQLARLGELVETVNNIHSRALRMEGGTAAGLVSASVERSSGRHDTNRRWAEAARTMRFTAEQAQKLLDVRREHLRRLHRIYEDRRQVNLEAISVLLPQERGGSAPSMSVERSKSWLPSMFHRSKHASRQKDVMKKLKDNLSEEQRLASELDYLVFRRILTPLQGAWFVLLKYPAYCDSLSLCNGVAEIHGQVDVDV